MAPKFLYLFLDESGNFDFSQKGSKFFTLTCIAKERPLSAYQELAELKYDLIEQGLDIEYFHASEDRQVVRDRVFELVRKHSERMRLDSFVIEKCKTKPADQSHDKFYPEAVGGLLQTVLGHYSLESYSEVLVVTDRLPEHGQRQSIEKALKPALASLLPSTARYRLLHPSSRSNFYLQIVDYCNWASFRKWERGDVRSYQLRENLIRTETDVLCNEQEKYY